VRVKPGDCGTDVNMGVTTAVDDPAANVTEVGETVVPRVMSPLQAMDTVRLSVTSPVRVSANSAGVETSGDGGWHPNRMTPCRATATVTETASCAAVVPMDSAQTEGAMPRARARRFRTEGASR
jgi:hypothetical protein